MIRRYPITTATAAVTWPTIPVGIAWGLTAGGLTAIALLGGLVWKLR